MWIFPSEDFFSPHSLSCVVFCLLNKVKSDDEIIDGREKFKMDQDFMKDTPIVPLVFKMSFPMVLSMLVNALYNIVDSYFVAQISDKAMTALSMVFPLQNFAMAVGVGFGIGVNAAAAFYLGAKKQKETESAIAQGILFNALHGILLTVFCIAVMPMFLRLFTQDKDVIQYGVEYSNLVFLFSTASTVGVTYEKIFQAVGRMKVSMFCMMCGCLVNIILDPVLIFGFGQIAPMGVTGAALATGIGQVVALVAYLIIYFLRPLPVRFKICKETLCNDGYKRLYLVGIPAILNMALPSVLITALNGILSDISEMYVLILGIYYKLQTFIYLTANGIVQGIRPLVGYNYGADRMDRVKAIFKTALLSGAGIMAVGTGLCIVFPDALIGMFTNDSDTILHGMTALRIISGGFVVSAVSVMVSGTFEGMGKGMPSLLISFIRYIVIIPIAFLLSRFFRENGVWNSFWITEMIAAAFSMVALKRIVFQKKSLA